MRIRLITGERGTSLTEAGEGDLLTGYLVSIATEYLKGQNAYTDWLLNKKNPNAPKPTPLQKFKCNIEH